MTANKGAVAAGRATISVDRPLVPFFQALAALLVVDEQGAVTLARQMRAPSDAVFRLRGGVWDLRLADSECLLPDRKGLRYIHQLLRSPGQAVAALRLAAGEEAFERLRAQRRQPLLDHQGRRELNAAISAASDSGPSQVGQYVRSATGRGGRTRTFATEAERARGAVLKAITSAIAAIDRHCPEIAHHLRASIDTGNFCVYRPIVFVEWELR
jgi:hypothetical protein